MKKQKIETEEAKTMRMMVEDYFDNLSSEDLKRIFARMKEERDRNHTYYDESIKENQQ